MIIPKNYLSTCRNSPVALIILDEINSRRVEMEMDFPISFLQSERETNTSIHKLKRCITSKYYLWMINVTLKCCIFCHVKLSVMIYRYSFENLEKFNSVEIANFKTFISKFLLQRKRIFFFIMSHTGELLLSVALIILFFY